MTIKQVILKSNPNRNILEIDRPHKTACKPVFASIVSISESFGIVAVGAAETFLGGISKSN